MKNVLGRGLSSLVSAQPLPVRVPGLASVPPVAEDKGPKTVKVEEQNTQGQGAVKTNIVLSNKTQADSEQSAESAVSKVSYIPVADISAGQYQPRQEFSEEEIKELCNSIQNHGLLQPILVRKNKPGPTGQYETTQFELIAGERRWRAAQMAGLLEVPALVRDLSDQESLEIAIIENVQRHDLNPLEEALAYQRLMNEFSLTQEGVAQKVGKERTTVANLLRLLKLAPEVQQLLKTKELSTGHAKALLTIKEPTAQLSLAKKAISEALTVRSLENVISRVVVLDTGTRKATEQFERGASLSESVSAFPEVLQRLRNALATKVSLKHKKNGSGSIEIQYHSENELDRLVETLCK